VALIERAADIDARNDDQGTPLHYACDMGHTEVAMALMERGADIDARDVDQETPLHSACYYVPTEVAMALMERGADIDARDKYQRTPLHSACSWGHTAVAMALMERGADIDARDDNQRTALHRACINGHTEVAMALIKRGADGRSVPSYWCSSLKHLFKQLWNFSPLMCALYENGVGLFRALLETYDESSDVSSADGWGVLHAGVYLGHRECVELYLQSERVSVAKRGMRAVVGEHASTALHIACARGDVTMVEAIVEQMSQPR